MSHASCPYEDAVATAARAGAWPVALSVHVAECAICREVAQTASWMQAVASTPTSSNTGSYDLATDPLPDPAAIWRSAQIAERRDNGNACRVLEWVQTALITAVSVGLAGWVVWNWYSIEAATAQFLANTLPMNGLPQFAAVTYALASLVPAALTLAALSMAYPLLATD